MTRRQAGLLWGLLAVGALVRLVLDFTTLGVEFDIDSFRRVARAMEGVELELYSAVNTGELVPRWPYPPGFLAWIEASQQIDQRLGLPFDDVVQLPAILADLAIAWLVQHHLGWRGADGRTRLVAAGAVALGPIFVFVSGYHGQIDALAILPALAAVVLWEQDRGGGSRAVWAGLLIGIGGGIKTVPLLMVLALWPTARSWRERLVLAGTAGAVPLLLLAPFLAADARGVIDGLSYVGRPGLGGLSLLVQPSLVFDWFGSQAFSYNALSRQLIEHAGLVNLAGVLAAGLVAYRRRLGPVEAAALVWLVVYAFGANWFQWYAVWGLPFFLIVSLRWGIAAQLALTVPATLSYFGAEWIARPDVVWVLVMVGVWLAYLVAIWCLATGRTVEDLRPGRRLALARGAGARWWRQPWLVRALWLVAVVQFAALAAVAYAAYDARAWDFWWIYLALDDYLAGRDPYDVYMFVNPPSTLLLLGPFSAVSFAKAHAAFLALSAVSIAAAGLLSLHAARVRWWGAAGAVLLLVLAHPSAVRSTLGLGNVNSLVVLCEAAALVAMLGARWTLGGIALGLSFAVKPILVPLLVVPLAARRWGSVAWAVGVPTVLSLLAIAINPDAIGFVTDKLSFLLSGNADVLQQGNVSVLGTAENLGLPRAAGEAARLATLVAALWLAWERWRAPGAGSEPDADRRLRVLETTGLLLLATLLCFSFSWLYYGVYLLPLAVTVAHPQALLRHPVALAGLAIMVVPFGDRLQVFDPQGFEIARHTLSWLLILAGMGLALRGPAALRIRLAPRLSAIR